MVERTWVLVKRSIIAENQSVQHVIPPSLNAMQPAVAQTARCPNRTMTGIENPGKLHDDDLTAL